MINIVKPYAYIDKVPDREAGVRLLRIVEEYARISHRSEEAATEDSWERFLRSVVLNHGDWSVAEHVSVSVVAEVDRGITHEWVRHRIGSYTQESTRFVNYSKQQEPHFICPPAIQAGVHGADARATWEAAMDAAQEAYFVLLRLGCPPQEARSVLPNGLVSKIAVTYNLRSWRHFLIMRTSKETHPQMRQVTEPLLREFQDKIPILYEDIVPGMKQSEAMRLLR